MGRPSDRGLPSDTNIGSPGWDVWYTSREPSRDQSNSATPSRYGLGWPPNVGAAQVPVTAPPEPSSLRTQNVTSEPSGENPGVRTSGLTMSAMLPRVKLCNCPEPTWVTQTSLC